MAISEDGNVVALESTATNQVHAPVRAVQVYARNNLTTGLTRLVSIRKDGDPGGNSARAGPVSASGRYVAFYSLARLVPADHHGGIAFDVYVRDTRLHTTRLVSVRH